MRFETAVFMTPSYNFYVFAKFPSWMSKNRKIFNFIRKRNAFFHKMNINALIIFTITSSISTSPENCLNTSKKNGMKIWTDMEFFVWLLLVPYMAFMYTAILSFVQDPTGFERDYLRKNINFHFHFFL